MRDADGLREAAKIILPGVGHFGQMMRALDEMGVRDALLERIRAGVPFLGICLGLQALFTSSEEAPEERGLGIFPGEVRRFQGEERIPHMGWNQIERVRETPLLHEAGEKPYLYFAHSYYCPVVPETAAVCDYIVPYTAVLESTNICGVQFHPEKSGDDGAADRAQFRGVVNHACKTHHSLSGCHRRPCGQRASISSTCATRAIRWNWPRAITTRARMNWCSSTSPRRAMIATPWSDVVARTAREVFIPLTVGGGIRSVDDARRILHAGADKVSVNTAAVRRPELITELSEEFGAQAVVLAIDAAAQTERRVERLHARRPR